MNAYSNLTDSELDAAFAAYWDAKDFASANIFVPEIISRLSSPMAYVSGLFGGSSFPLYEARTGFSQSGAAQSSTSSAAGSLASGAVAGVGKSVLGISTPIIVLLIAGGIFLYMAKK